MTQHRLFHLVNTGGVIAVKGALALVIIIGGIGLLAYEWHHAQTPKVHQGPTPQHQKYELKR